HLRVFDYIGFHAYFLTFCTFERSPVFITADAVALVLEQISRAARDCSFAVLAYCFMPDHVHLLVEGRSSKQYRTKLWQRYSYEHVLRDHEKSVDAARYILGNPVQAGLTKRAEHYPYSGSLSLPRAVLFDWTFGTSG